PAASVATKTETTKKTQSTLPRQRKAPCGVNRMSSLRRARRRRTPVVVLQPAGNASVHRRSRQTLHHADNVFRDRVDAIGFGASMHARGAASDAVRVAGEEAGGVDAEEPINDTTPEATLLALERVRVGDLLEKRPMSSYQIASTVRTHRSTREGSRVTC